MEEKRMIEKVKENTKRLIDLTLKAAGIRGLLFRTDAKLAESSNKEPTDLDSEIDYQRCLIAELESDLGEIERKL